VTRASRPGAVVRRVSCGGPRRIGAAGNDGPGRGAGVQLARWPVGLGEARLQPANGLPDAPRVIRGQARCSSARCVDGTPRIGPGADKAWPRHCSRAGAVPAAAVARRRGSHNIPLVRRIAAPRRNAPGARLLGNPRRAVPKFRQLSLSPAPRPVRDGCARCGNGAAKTRDLFQQPEGRCRRQNRKQQYVRLKRGIRSAEPRYSLRHQSQ
jgi:hypothetical protein